MFSLRVFLPLFGALGALSQSVKSCGGPSDHLSNVAVTVTPDPPVKGKPVTIKIVGDLDEDITAGTVNVSLHGTAMGIISSTVKQLTPFTLSPAFVKGHREITIGPTTMTPLPGSVTLKGQIRVVDGNNEEVACAELDLDMVAEGEEEEVVMTSENATLDAVQDCSKAADHLKGLSITTSAGVTTVTGSLDEPLKMASLDVNLVVKKLFIHKQIQATVPIADSTGFPAGAMKVTVGPVSGSVSPDPKVSVSGTMTLSDEKKEEVTCLKVNGVLEDTAATESIVV